MEMSADEPGVLIHIDLARRLYSLTRSYVAELEHRGWGAQRERATANELMDAIVVAEAGLP